MCVGPSQVPPKHIITTGHQPLAEAMQISEEEVAAVMRNPLVFELQRRLYTKVRPGIRCTAITLATYLHS